MVNSEATAGIIDNLAKLVDEIQESNAHLIGISSSLVIGLAEIAKAIHALTAALEAKY